VLDAPGVAVADGTAVGADVGFAEELAVAVAVGEVEGVPVGGTGVAFGALGVATGALGVAPPPPAPEHAGNARLARTPAMAS
jgi:hypothetical protein